MLPRTLQNAIEAGRLAHAILFAGPRGTGKTTIARILAKAVNCEQGPAIEPCNQCRSCREITDGGAADVFEIDGASNNSVEQVRELRDNLQYMPAHSRRKIYIIDEVHMLSGAAFNALLKTLEEPPQHVMFMFATTEPHKIPITILSRCQRHDLRRIETQAIVDRMAWICHQEQINIDDSSLGTIARCADGSLRDALSLLDQVIASARDQVSLADITRMLAMTDSRMVKKMAAAVLANDIKQVLRIVEEIYSMGDDLQRFYLELTTVFRHLNVLRLGKDARSLVDLPDDEARKLEELAASVDATRLQQIFDTLVRSEAMVKLAIQPRLALEMILVRLAQTPPVLPIETLITKIEQVRKSLASSPATGPAEHREKSGSRFAPSVQNSIEDARPVEHFSLNPAKLLASWKELANNVSQQKPSLGVLLQKSKPLDFRQGELSVEVAGNGFTVKSIEKSRALIEDLAGKVIGSPVKLRIKANITPAEEKRKQKAALERSKQKALGHTLVTDALEIFNGKIYDVRIKQRETGGKNP